MILSGLRTSGLILAFWASIALGLAQQPKLARDLSKDPEATVDVIVQYTAPPTAEQHKKITDKGGKLKADLGFIHAGSYTVHGKDLDDLANDPAVLYVSPDRVVSPALDIANPTVNANIARQYGWTGAGIGIALIDSGVQSNSDLNGPSLKGKTTSRIVYSQNFSTDSDASDRHGHGTHVAGVLAGGGNMSTGSGFTRSFIGIANDANIINLKVLNSSGQGTDRAVISAIQEAITLKSKNNMRVINLSLGRPVYESYTLDPLCQAVEKAWKAGIVVVVAAGNDGRDNSFGTNGYDTI